jgi:hypothetical protein
MGRQAPGAGTLSRGTAHAQQIGFLLNSRAPEFEQRTAGFAARLGGLRHRARASALLCSKSWPSLEEPYASPSGKLRDS